jgi:RNA polymerase sigma-70 factor (ECF subfamily)
MKKRPTSAQTSSRRSPGNSGSAEIDVPAPEEILLKYWPQIGYRVKNSLGRATPDWEDVVSEVLLDVVKALRQRTFRGDSSLGTFIYAVTPNKIIDQMRQKKKVLTEVPELGRDFDPALDAEARERVGQIAGFLKRLKPKYADILYLRYYLDVPPGEIARIYGTSTGTMYKLIRRARTNLKGLLRALSPPRTG